MGIFRKRGGAKALEKAYYRANTTLLLWTVMLFQFTALLLLACKTAPLDAQALLMALLVPGGTLAAVYLFCMAWPVDRALLILTLFLCSIGLVTLQDIARSPVTPRNQAIFVLLGLGAMAAGIAFIRALRHWEKWTPYLMGLSIAALLLPLAFGKWQYGAKNWIYLFGVSVQPSEFVKLSLILALASGLSNRPRFLKSLPALAFAAAACALLLAERDLGALLLYFLVAIGMYYAATSNWLIALSGLGAGAAGAVAAYHLFPYVNKRVEMFVNPWSDPLDKGWQIIQALIAIGSGGAFGMGLGLGYPRNIPLYHSDFVFAAISEEFGLIFSICLLAAYVLIVLRGVSIAMSARTSFHALTAFGFVLLVGIQAFVIVGGNIKLIPLTGVTLPFISAGGSSMLSMMGGMGLLLGVSSINANDEAEDLARMEWREEGAE